MELFKNICTLVFTLVVLAALAFAGYSIYSESIQKEIAKKSLKLPEGYEIEYSKQIDKYRWVFNDGTNTIYGVTHADTKEDAIQNAIDNKIEKETANPEWKKEPAKVEKW